MSTTHLAILSNIKGTKESTKKGHRQCDKMTKYNIVMLVMWIGLWGITKKNSINVKYQFNQTSLLKYSLIAFTNF
jgi:hypothetical protein